jgi:VanZ family protein
MRFTFFKLPGWLVAVLWMAFIFILSALPGGTVNEVSGGVLGFNHLDKVAHGTVYAVLGWLWMRALWPTDRRTLPKALALAIIITVAYGATDEWHQYFVPGRDCNLSDWAADAIGGALGAALYYGHDTQRRRKTS